MKWVTQIGKYEISTRENRILESLEIKEMVIKIQEDWEYIEQIDERITAKISKEKFNDMFGPDAKPRKGDALSVQNIGKKFKIKKVRNKSKKKGKKNYTVELETVKN